MNKKRVLCLILTCVFCLCFIAPLSATGQSNVISIHDEAEFLAFVENCVLDTWSQGKEFQLTDNIDLSGLGFACVPTFGGVFDGGGFTISGLFIEGAQSQTGLFSYIQQGAVVKNLNVIGAITPIGAQELLGGIAGTNSGTIQNCVFRGAVNGNASIGGITGHNEGSGLIIGCEVFGTVSGTHYTGGIAGYNSGSIINCTNSSMVNTDYVEVSLSIEDIEIDFENLNSTENAPAHTDTGGICGYSSGVVEYCTNNGNVGYPHVGYNIGGIAGRQSGYMNGCVNHAAINGRKDVGGIAGQMAPDVSLIFSVTEIQKLEDEIKKLNRLIDDAILDASYASGSVSDELAITSSYLDVAQNSIEAMNRQITNFTNENIDSVNALGDVMREYLGMLPDIMQHLEDVAIYTEQAFFEMWELVAQLDGMMGLSDDAIAELEECVSHLQTASGYFSVGVTTLRTALEYLERSVSFPDVSTEIEQLQADSAALDAAIIIFMEAATAAANEYESTGTIIPATRAELVSSFAGVLTCAADVASGINDIIQKIDWEEIDGNSEDLQNAMLNLTRAMSCFADAFNEVNTALSHFSAFIEAIERTDNADSTMVAQLKTVLAVLQSAANSLSNATNKLKIWAAGFSNESRINFSSLGHEYTESSERLNAALTGFSSSLSSLNNQIDASSQALLADMQAVNTQTMVVMNILLNAMNEMENVSSTDQFDYYEDISDAVLFDSIDGKVLDCVNNGMVDGDVNVGGVAGSMAIEYDFDPEDDVSTSGNRSYDFKYQTQAVLIDCINNGNITSKKDCVGGMVGLMDLGTVYACENYGYISSTSGDYVGGIAGESLSAVRNSYAKCFLSGRRYIGGIAGYGENISCCYTLVKVLEAAQNAGAIAGEAIGTLSENYFVSDELAGVDRISLSEKAEPMDYADLLAVENLPVEFQQFKLVFVADGTIVERISFKYNASLDNSEMPGVPYKEGNYGEWSITDLSNLKFDEVVEAIYTRYNTTLASNELRENGQSVILVDGQFLKTDSLSITERDATASGLEGAIEHWIVSIPDNGAGEYTVRYQALENCAKRTSIYINMNGTWKQAETSPMGRYLLFAVSGNEVAFATSLKPQNEILQIAIVIVITLLVIVFMLAKISKKSKHAEHLSSTFLAVRRSKSP